MLQLSYQNKLTECGTDEAGRGCLAGPVTAAAVILPKQFKNKWLDDSKKLSAKKRDELKEIILNEARAHAICHVSWKEIDEINILQASILAMQRSIAQLTPSPEFIAVDGNKFKPFKDLPHQCIIKGDSKYLNIAAASILAKTARDEFMEKIHQEFPAYQWNKNKGYPTKAHRAAIKEFGVTPYHRKSFQLLPSQLSLNL